MIHLTFVRAVFLGYLDSFVLRIRSVDNYGYSGGLSSADSSRSGPPSDSTFYKSDKELSQTGIAMIFLCIISYVFSLWADQYGLARIAKVYYWFDQYAKGL